MVTFHFLINIIFFAEQLFLFEACDFKVAAGVLELLCRFIKNLLCFDFLLFGMILFVYYFLQVAFDFTNFRFKLFLNLVSGFQCLMEFVDLALKRSQFMFFSEDARQLFFTTSSDDSLMGNYITLFGDNRLK